MRNVFFDIGPGVSGTEAWKLSWLKDYQIIGLEPDPKRFMELKDTFPGLLLNYAVSDKNGSIRGECPSRSGFTVVGREQEAGRQVIEVKTFTLDTIDNLFGNFDRCRIWADIEGSELRMLKGAESVLKKTDWILLEVRQSVPHSEWCKAEEVYRFLEERGFKPDKPLMENGHYDVTFTKKICT